MYEGTADGCPKPETPEDYEKSLAEYHMTPWKPAHESVK